MILIIDGYNLLFARKSRSRETGQSNFLEKSRETLLLLIETAIPENLYQKITIVFDGKTPSKSIRKSSPISIIFSGEEKADELVIKIAKEESHPRKVTVVTSDREIIERLKPMGVKIIRSQDFIQEYLQLSVNSQDKQHTPALSKRKLYGISPEEAEKWLEIFGIDL